jgi:hypothetical protein
MVCLTCRGSNVPDNCCFLHRAVPVAADLYQKVKIVLTSVTLQKKKHVTESKGMLLHSFYDLAWRIDHVPELLMYRSLRHLSVGACKHFVHVSFS